MELPLPRLFTGRQADWDDWSWTFKLYLHAIEPTLAPFLDEVEAMPLEVTDDDLTDKDNMQLTIRRVTFSRELHCLLAFITEDGAKLVVKQNKTDNGFETWRLLSAHFKLPTEHVGQLTCIMNYTFREQDFEKDFDKWEDLKNEYEKATKSPLPDAALIELLPGKIGDSFLTHLRLNLTCLSTFAQLKHEILSYRRSLRALAQNTATSAADDKEPTSMQIGGFVNFLQKEGPLQRTIKRQT